MKNFAHFCSIVFILAGMSHQAFADQRILLSFDSAGHHVRQIIKDSSTSSLQSQQADVFVAQWSDLQTVIATLQPGYATLIWLDDHGNWYAKTRESDPRVSRSPTHISGAANTQVGGNTGAWLVSGPSAANRLIILLPDNSALGIGFEQWEVVLE